jgi:hypothetical protein
MENRGYLAIEAELARSELEGEAELDAQESASEAVKKEVPVAQQAGEAAAPASA